MVYRTNITCSETFLLLTFSAIIQRLFDFFISHFSLRSYFGDSGENSPFRPICNVLKKKSFGLQSEWDLIFNISIKYMVQLNFIYYHRSVNKNICYPANALRKSHLILWLYFGNLRKLLFAKVDIT